MKKNIKLDITLDWSNDIEKCNISINDKTHNILDIDYNTTKMIKDIMSESEKQEIIDNFPDTSKCFKEPTTKTIVEQLKGNKHN